MSPHRHRAITPRSRIVLMFVVAAVLAGLVAVLIGQLGMASSSRAADWSGPDARPSASVSAPEQPPEQPSPSPSASPKPVLAMNVKFPRSGPGKYTYAMTTGPILGTAGPIRKFRVAIESNIKVVQMPDLLAKINDTLGDDRSWVGGGTYRLRQVPPSSPAQFTIYLVTSATSSALCAPLDTGGYTSCRQGSRVVFNLDRWMKSVPSYVQANTPLDTYRTYMINHEVGHALGNGHQLCPGHGKLAPVMEQQTLGLHGCTPNPWPYLNGKKYAGPPGRY